MAPIWFIVWMISGLAWLLHYTSWMRVDLMQPIEHPVLKYAKYEVYNALRKCKFYHGRLREGGNLPEDYSPNGEPNYTIVLNPGIKDILCGWEWLDYNKVNNIEHILKQQANKPSKN